MTKILFDATELSYFLEESGHRAGVFFVALNLFRELKKRKDVELVFCCNFKRYYFLKEVIEKVEEFQGIELLKENSLINLAFAKLNYLAECKQTKQSPPLEGGEAVLFERERKLEMQGWGHSANNPTPKSKISTLPQGAGSSKLKYAILSLSRYYENIFYKQNKKNIEELKDFEIYFSPFQAPSEEILHSKHLKRFRMIHDIIPILEAGKIPTNKRLWCYRIYNTINQNDFYVTNSECTRKDVLKYFDIKEENIKTTLLGADATFTPPLNPNLSGNNTQLFPSAESQGAGKPTKYVFSLCTLGKRKNLIFAIKNFFKFIEKNKINDLKLVLAGGVWEKFKKELTNTIGDFDQSKIEVLGYVKDEELPRLYSNALMFIYPSLYEGFGLPVLEAMKCGCPVITSNVSSLPEVIGQAGIQINPTNDEELIEAYEKMYYDNFFRELCIERGLIRAKNFSWEKCASELLEFIETNGV